MLVGTHSDRILETLRQSGRPLDDDQLSERAEIGSWQQVNRICRNLERRGRIRRIVGPDQRIVNEFVAPAYSGVALDSNEQAVLGAVLGSPLGGADPVEFDSTTGAFGAGGVINSGRRFGARATDSFDEADPRRAMLDRLGERLGVALDPATVKSESGSLVEIGGANPDRTILVECRPRSGQAHEVLADALKLSWLGGTGETRPRLVLCFASAAAAEQFQPDSGSWAAHALHDLGIAVEVV